MKNIINNEQDTKDYIKNCTTTKTNVDVSKEINSAYIELKSNEMEFIDEIAIQLTENTFGEDTFVPTKYERNKLRFTEEAQDFYNERYDEIETLYINLIKNK
tara:strand:- start:77 stop:382 length:306 start_codon:yes stop_codon:yes gene_type:complete